MPLDMPPFPQLTWNGFFWTAQVSLPDFLQEHPVGIDIRVPIARVVADEASSPRPSPEQAAAYEFLLGDGPSVRDALLTATRDKVPEWAEWPLTRVADEVRLSGLTVHTSAWDGAAYIGDWLSPTRVETWLTEHGAGVTAHHYREVAIGMGEDSRDEAASVEDLRRHKRSHRGQPRRRG